MKPKNIVLANKCVSCCWFEPIEGTCSGYCLRNKYGEDVVHDPAHPYWQVARSRIKCVDYNAKPQTNADHIRSMTDEELADYMSDHSIEDFCYIICGGECKAIATFNKTAGQRCREIVSDWLKHPYKEEA